MKQQTKLILFGYGIFLVIMFLAGPHLGVVNHTMIYNITCDNGDVQWFNESTIEVCGQKNPLTEIKENTEILRDDFYKPDIELFVNQD